MDFTNYGCVAIVVMTHGGKNGLLMAKDVPYYERDILNYFKHEENRTLFTKPVVVIIEACRGDSDMKAAEVGRKCESSAPEKVLTIKEVEHYHLEVEPNTIVLHSSSVRKASLREYHIPYQRKGDGTWFIKALCNAINSLSITHDLESIMTEVKRKVAIDKFYTYEIKDTHQWITEKQMPVVSSRLIRKLYLRKFRDEPPIIQRDGISNVSSADILKQYKDMRKILQRYAKDVHDLTAEFLLRNSAVNDTNCDTNSMKLKLLAMSYFLKDKLRSTLHQDYVMHYDIV